MNNYTDSAIEQDNLHTIEKLIHKSVYTLGHQATQESFSEAFIQRIIGGSMANTRELNHKDAQYVWHPFTQMGVYAKMTILLLKKVAEVIYTILKVINI